MYWEEINRHMNKKMSKHKKGKIEEKVDTEDYVSELDRLPNKATIETMELNKFYKVAFSTISIEVEDFFKMEKHTSIEIFDAIMSEFTFGITKIMENHGVVDIVAENSTIVGIFSGKKKSELDATFNCACSINTFSKHLNKWIRREFNKKLKYGTFSTTPFEYGIGVFFSSENYVSRTKHGVKRKLSFKGESIDNASYLSKVANRKGRKEILMNDLFIANLTKVESGQIRRTGGFTSYYDKNIKEEVHGCDWIIKPYDNYVDDSLKKYFAEINK